MGCYWSPCLDVGFALYKSNAWSEGGRDSLTLVTCSWWPVDLAGVVQEASEGHYWLAGAVIMRYAGLGVCVVRSYI